MSHYEKAWQDVRMRIARACAAAGRSPASVELLAVSKMFPAQAIREVHALGQRAFGENYVQEALTKQDELRDMNDVQWHFIGPLQANKTRAIAAHFDWVESVDRPQLAQRLSAQRPATAAPLAVCVQVNASGETTKSG